MKGSSTFQVGKKLFGFFQQKLTYLISCIPALSGIFGNTNDPFGYKRDITQAKKVLQTELKQHKQAAFMAGLTSEGTNPIFPLFLKVAWFKACDIAFRGVFNQLVVACHRIQARFKVVTNELLTPVMERANQIYQINRPKFDADMADASQKKKNQPLVESMIAAIDSSVVQIQTAIYSVVSCLFQVPVKNFIDSAISAVLLGTGILGAEFVSTVGVFRNLGLEEGTVYFLTFSLSAIIGASSFLAGEATAKDDARTKKWCMAIGIGAIAFLLLVRIIAGAVLYFILLNILFWAMGYVVSRVRCLRKLYFDYCKELEKKQNERALLVWELENLKRNNLKLEQDVTNRHQSLALETATAKDRSLKFEQIELTENELLLQSQMDELELLKTDIKESGLTEIEKSFARGVAERKLGYSGRFGKAAAWFLPFAFTVLSCSEEIDVHMGVDNTQKELQKTFAPADVVSFLADNVFFPDGYVTTCDNWKITCDPIDDLIMGNPRSFELPGVANPLGMVKKDRDMLIHSTLDTLAKRFDAMNLTAFGRDHTKLYQWLCRNLSALDKSDADKKYVLAFTDGLHHDEVASFYKYKSNPKALMGDYESLSNALHNDCPLTDFEVGTIEVVFFCPADRNSQLLVHEAQKFWRKLLESQGITVSFHTVP